MNSIVYAIVLGGFFGFALYYAGASYPQKLLAMLRLENLTLMKIILFAIGLASSLIGITAICGVFEVSHLSIKPLHFGVIIGGIIFGIGFGYAGTCPGTTLAALTTGGCKKAFGALLGGILGALVYSLSYGAIAATGFFQIFHVGRLNLFSLTNDTTSILSSGFFGLLLMGILFMIIGYFIPERIK